MFLFLKKGLICGYQICLLNGRHHKTVGTLTLSCHYRRLRYLRILKPNRLVLNTHSPSPTHDHRSYTSLYHIKEKPMCCANIDSGRCMWVKLDPVHFDQRNPCCNISPGKFSLSICQACNLITIPSPVRKSTTIYLGYLRS